MGKLAINLDDETLAKARTVASSKNTTLDEMVRSSCAPSLDKQSPTERKRLSFFGSHSNSWVERWARAPGPARTCMSGRSFLDTNILVYAYDFEDPAKQKRAAQIVEEGVRDDTLALSTQVLGEFFVTVTRKIIRPLTPQQAVTVLGMLLAAALVEIDRPLVDAAIAAHLQYQISYWDGLIIAAAERAGCGKILSEDLSDGQRYGTVVVENPFRTPSTPAP
jgi:predicted nucleic acid-binding protein